MSATEEEATRALVKRLKEAGLSKSELHEDGFPPDLTQSILLPGSNASTVSPAGASSAGAPSNTHTGSFAGAPFGAPVAPFVGAPHSVGAGTITLSGRNNYAGGVTIGGGTPTIAGSETVVIAGGVGSQAITLGAAVDPDSSSEAGFVAVTTPAGGNLASANWAGAQDTQGAGSSTWLGWLWSMVPSPSALIPSALRSTPANQTPAAPDEESKQGLKKK